MAHIHELYDFTIGVFIVHDRTVLFVNHPRYDRWLPPGGHIELNEDPDEALMREIKEETGLTVTILSQRAPFVSPETKNLLQPAYIDVHEANPPHRHIGLNYFATTAAADAKLSDEHRELKWFTLEELRDPAYRLSAALIFYAEAALQAAAES